MTYEIIKRNYDKKLWNKQMVVMRPSTSWRGCENG